MADGVALSSTVETDQVDGVRALILYTNDQASLLSPCFCRFQLFTCACKPFPVAGTVNNPVGSTDFNRRIFHRPIVQGQLDSVNGREVLSA
jgi:hypothetical protein